MQRQFARWAVFELRTVERSKPLPLNPVARERDAQILQQIIGRTILPGPGIVDATRKRVTYYHSYSGKRSISIWHLG